MSGSPPAKPAATSASPITTILTLRVRRQAAVRFPAATTYRRATRFNGHRSLRSVRCGNRRPEIDANRSRNLMRIPGNDTAGHKTGGTKMKLKSARAGAVIAAAVLAAGGATAAASGAKTSHDQARFALNRSAASVKANCLGNAGAYVTIKNKGPVEVMTID